MWWPLRKIILPSATCTGDRFACECRAFRWDHCTGGRCKYHCGELCKCVPVPAAGQPLRVFTGGKGKAG